MTRQEHDDAIAKLNEAEADLENLRDEITRALVDLQLEKMQVEVLYLQEHCPGYAEILKEQAKAKMDKLAKSEP